MTEIDFRELGNGELIHTNFPSRDPGEIRIVGDDRYAISTRVDISLDVCRPDRDRSREGKQCVLGSIHREAPVCEHTGAGRGQVGRIRGLGHWPTGLEESGLDPLQSQGTQR